MSRKAVFTSFVIGFFFLCSLLYLSSQTMVSANSNSQSDSLGESDSTEMTTFIDVGNDHWAKDNIEYLSSLNIIKGYENQEGNNYFLPSEKVTRAQTAKMVIEALGYKPLNVTKSSFSDIPDNYWAIGYIEKAKELKIFEGYQDGTFGPSDSLKRSQMAKVIVEAFNLNYNGYEPSSRVFSDVPADYWAYPYIEKLHYNGISNGSNYRFKPEDQIGRAEFSAFLSRTINPQFKVKITGPRAATGKVVANILNVRSGMSTSTAIVGKLSYGTVVSVRAIEGDWAQINSNGITGYVYKSYLKLYSIDPSKPLLNRIIVIDAGHGDQDPGSTVGTIYEKDIVLRVSNYLVNYLEAAGAQVVQTRETDEFLTLEERVKFTESVNGEAFVSIHANAAGSTAARGTEVYYDTKTNQNGSESEKLAREIQEQIVADANMYDRGIKDSGFYVIRNNNIPAVLVELGFLTNAEDRQKLTSDQYQRIYAKAIFDGIVEYYKN